MLQQGEHKSQNKKQREKNYAQASNLYSVGGIIGKIHTIFDNKISNCYNTGSIRVDCDGPSQWVGGISGQYWTWGGYARCNYNVGKVSIKHKDKTNKTKGSALFGVVAEPRMAKKRLATDNYYTKPAVAYASCEGIIKKLMPTSKKVSRITKANCPKLSYKYWVYSSKVKRLVLKNNNESKAVKKKGKKKASK